MTETTTHLSLPMIVPGQVQKEMTHNEALVILDTVVQASVASAGAATPPVDPVPGGCWIVGDDPSGAWAGRAHQIATWTLGGWRFVAPRAGFRVWVASVDADARFDGSVWIIAEPYAAIDQPSGGAVIDAAARGAISSILDALRRHNLVETP